MSNLLGVPVVLPLVTAITLMCMEGRPRLKRRVALSSGLVGVAAVGLLVERAACGSQILVLRLGNWGPELGIIWIVDSLASIMLALSQLISLATVVYAPGGLRSREVPHFYALHQFLLAGVNGCFVTGDYFNLFVFFEVMLLASFCLICLGGRPRQVERVFPYVLLSLVASAMLLAAIGVIYGIAGTVNMALLSERVTAGDMPAAFWAAIGLMFTAFSIKTGLAPLFFWLPDSYPEAPLPIAAMFAGLLTKVGVYTLFRSLPLLGVGESEVIRGTLLVIASATMLLGVLGALGRQTIRGILSFHIISQVGYMIFGLALYSQLAVAAGIFYIVHHVVVKTALFFAGGIAERVAGSGRLGAVKGLLATHPLVAVGFFVPALALAGLPPFSGFWGKFFLIHAGFGLGAWWSTGIALVVGFLTLASMLKIWVTTFWGEPEGQAHAHRGHDPGMLGATLGLAAVSVAIGLAAGPLFAVSARAAAELLAVRPYVDAVLGGGL
jgi:multicomponent Na+:H+ antiporter subunit D